MARTKAEIRKFLDSQVGKRVVEKTNRDLDGQCVTLIKALLEFLGAPNPYQARGHAKDAASTYVAHGIAKNGDGWLRVVVNPNMGVIGGVRYGHIWLDLKNETNYESNGAKALTVTKGTRPYSQRVQVVNLDKYIKADAPKPAPKPSPAKGDYKVVKSIKGYVSAANAKARRSSNSTVPAGTYYTFNTASGMRNISRVKGQPGWWINPADNKASAPAPAKQTYTVRSGDTMSGIAAKYKLSLASLAKLNPQIKNLHRIDVGQKVRVK